MSIVGTTFSEPLVTIHSPQPASAIFVPSRPIANAPQFSGANYAAVASAPNLPFMAGENFMAEFLAPHTPCVADSTYVTSPTIVEASQSAGAPFVASQLSPNPSPAKSAAPVNINSQTTAVSVSGPAVVSSPAEPKRSLPTIKLNSYDGSTPLQTHLSKLDNCAAYYDWNAHDRFCHLKASLMGQAGEVLWQLSPASNESDVGVLLKNRFGSNHQTERYQIGLQNRRRQTDESIQSLYNDIRRLLALGGPGKTGDSVVEGLGKDYFFSGII